MAITVDWTTKTINIPQADLTFVSGTFYTLDTHWFKNQLRALEAGVYGIANIRMVDHNTEYTVAGVTYARKVEIINGYSVTFEDGQYSVQLNGSNNNVWDIGNNILNQNQVQVIPTNSAGLIINTVGSGIDSDDMDDFVDKVFDELMSGHVDTGSFGAMLYDFARMTKYNVVMDGDIATVYEADGETVWRKFDLANDGRVMEPYDSLIDNIDLGLDSTKWHAGAIANDGHVYGAPYRSSQVLEINPETRLMSTWGDVGSSINKWYNLTLASDGLLYGIPNNTTDVLEIDPINKTTNLYPGATSPIATVVKWPVAVLADNGKIYGIPNRAQDVLEFDPVTKGINLFGGFEDNVTKWGSGVLASDGKIYCGPSGDETAILEIDPTVPSATKRELGISLFGAYNDSIYANGKVYLIPLSATGVGVFDIVTKVFTTVGNYSGSNKWNHAVMGGNGKIYCIPRQSTYVLEIDPTNDSVTTFGDVGDADADLKWNKGVLGPNGKIYAFPAYDWETILEIDPATQTAREFGSYVSTATMRWPVAIRASNGNIYGIPVNIDSAIEIDL